jgi:hypothetical protein
MKTKWVIGFLCVLVVAAYAMITWASPPLGVTPFLIGRATFESFKVKTDPHAPFDYMAQAKPGIDMVVRTHDYAPGSYTGWHTHPGPVFISVLEGSVTFYEYDDPTCTPKVVTAGQGYVDTGHGHIGRNETGLPAKDVTVFILPVGETHLREELSAPGPYCTF